MLLVFILTCLCALGEFRVEARVRVRFEDSKIVTIDPEYLDPEKTKVEVWEDVEYMDTCLKMTLEFIKTPPPDARAFFNLWSMTMGKYTNPSGLHFDKKLCDTLEDPYILGPFVDVLAFRRSACPPPPGTYHLAFYNVPTQYLSSGFPDNRYEADVEIKIKGKPMLSVKIFMDISTVN